jgi:hypothetical protein
MLAPMWVLTNQVDVNLFDVFDVPILGGRSFVEADRRDGAPAVIVNRRLADRIGGGGDVLGRRVREIVEGDPTDPDDDEVRPWLEIVGIVPDFPTPVYYTAPESQLYRPVALDRATSVTLAVRVGGGSAPAFTNRLRAIAAAIDPMLQLHDLESIAVVRQQTGDASRYTSFGILAGTLAVLMLSAAGIYAMLSFTVARRRREIGIRTALGADARRILAGIFRRAAGQIGAGIAAGVAVAAVLSRGGSTNEFTGDQGWILVPLVSAIMLVVGLLAALGPARRGLAVQPTEALRED